MVLRLSTFEGVTRGRKNAYMSSFYRNRLSILRALQIWILKSFKNFLKILKFFLQPITLLVRDPSE